MNKVLIAVPTAEYARQAIFYDFFNMMEKPIGTIITFAHGQSPARNRNLMIQQALDHDCTHVLFLDDDLAFEPDLLTRLLTHDVDLVSGIYFMRSFPHNPIIFDNMMPDGKCSARFLHEGDSGLIPVVATGLGCLLINTRVFRTMEEPWIRMGELEKDHWCDDIGFYYRARYHGFKAYCDLDVKVGHMATVTIWPKMIDGKWFVSYDTHGIASITVPAPETNLVVKEEENVSA